MVLAPQETRDSCGALTFSGQTAAYTIVPITPRTTIQEPTRGPGWRIGRSERGR